MAKITFKNQSEYFLKLKAMEVHFMKDETLERAVARGAAPVADAIRKNLEALPDEKFKRLKDGEKFNVLSESAKRDLSAGFGLTPMERDKNGFLYTKAGFEGYGSHPTKSYPQGVPIPMMARAIESGSSVREKMPFVRPAVNATRKEAIKEMEKSIDEDMKKIFEGGK